MLWISKAWHPTLSTKQLLLWSESISRPLSERSLPAAHELQELPYFFGNQLLDHLGQFLGVFLLGTDFHHPHHTVTVDQHRLGNALDLVRLRDLVEFLLWPNRHMVV